MRPLFFLAGFALATMDRDMDRDTILCHGRRRTCRYMFYDIYIAEYLSDFRNWDLAIITLEEPVGLKTGWMGIKALPPPGACIPGSSVLKQLVTVGYPVEVESASEQYTSTCDLQVRPCACSLFCNCRLPS